MIIIYRRGYRRDVLDSRAVVGLGERNILLSPGSVIMYANGATMEAFREFKVLWWVLLDDYFAYFREKNSPEGYRGSGSSTGSQQHFWLPKGLNVREPGHHGDLHGVKSVMVGHVEGPFTVSKNIWVADGRGSSTGSTITLWTPWRPPWWSGSRKCPGRRLCFCCWTAPLNYYFFESLRKNHQQEPPKHFGLLEASMVAPFPNMPREESTLTWSYYRSRIQHFTEAEGGFIQFFFFIFFYISFSCNTKKIKLITSFLCVWERNSFCADISWRPCIYLL